jgi:uncharacterized coiled-coil DUF342 family protein
MNESKYPQFEKMRGELEKERAELLTKSEPLRKQREALLTKLQPLENELRGIDAKIKEIERPRLAELDSQLGKLAVAMGGRSLNEAKAGGSESIVAG